MDHSWLSEIALAFAAGSPLLYVQERDAIHPSLCGMRMFEMPLFAIGAADDPYFKRLQSREAVGKHFILPEEWLPGAKTVISFFLPFTAVVKRGNARDMQEPSPEWLYARIEGQGYVDGLTLRLKEELERMGGRVSIPLLDPRYWNKGAVGAEEDPEEAVSYTSNWSERHVAYVCGLGTFALSKGLITEAGLSGRFGSLITDLQWEPDTRPYTGLYEYCVRCGACARNCPAGAISLETGKNHKLCCDYIDITRITCKPRFGCGKCQVKVPCESRNPFRRARQSEDRAEQKADASPC